MKGKNPTQCQYSGSRWWPTYSNIQKQHIKSITCLHTAHVVSSKCLEESDVPFDSKTETLTPYFQPKYPKKMGGISILGELSLKQSILSSNRTVIGTKKMSKPWLTPCRAENGGNFPFRGKLSPSSLRSDKTLLIPTGGKFSKVRL